MRESLNGMSERIDARVRRTGSTHGIDGDRRVTDGDRRVTDGDRRESRRRRRKKIAHTCIQTDMRTWIIVALFAGVILVMVNEYASTVPERVEYRYLPRDLDDYIRTAPVPTTVFGAMFTEYDAIPGQFDHVTT